MVSTSTGIDHALEVLERLEIPRDHAQVELRFLKMFICCLTNCEESGEDSNWASLMIGVESVLKESGLLTVTQDNMVEDLDSFFSSLVEKLEHFKPKMREISAVLLESSRKYKSCSSDETLTLIEFLARNLKDLVKLNSYIVVSVRKQIMVLKEKLSFLINLVDFTAKRCFELKKLVHFLDYVMDWVHNAACLSLLSWLDGKDEKMTERLETMHSDLLKKIKPYTPEVAGMFVGVLKASKPSKSDKPLVGQIVEGLADLFLEDLFDPLEDYVEILREGLIFVIHCFMDPSEDAVTNARGDGIFKQINVVFKEVLSLVCSLYMDHELKVDASIERRISLSSFQYKIEKMKKELGEHYVQVPSSSNFDFPLTNGLGFFDFFLGNLKEMLEINPSNILFAKHQVLVVQQGLLPLKPFLKIIMELEKDLWKRIINVVYEAEHVIASCSIIDHPIWYDMLCLSNVIEDIRLIKTEVRKFNDQLQNSGRGTNTRHLLPMQASTNSTLDEVVVGLKEDSLKIIDRLKRGTTHLDIVSIVGMPGLGKTTLAKKVYNDPSVKYHFNRCAWCCVSQVHKGRDIILDIIADLNGEKTRSAGSTATDDDLADQLRKALKGRRYLIVMDDIWDIEAWESIRLSFPDDNNGSRIMFTSRIHNLFPQAKLNCSPDYPLRTLAEEESWELLQEKLFHKDRCPPELSEIGKNIARNCKGLPLSVVLIAGILAKTNKSIDWWKQIEESTSSQVASEGCMDVLELSYKHLPDSLKSCFLYFGAFPEDRVVRVRKLMNLWIAERLIPRTDKKSLYKVAEEYMIDLIDRSLVILAERSSKGGLKACRVHDLLRDLCLSKIREDKYLQWVHDSDVSSHSSITSKRHDEYRLCIDAQWTPFIESKPDVPLVRSLILFGYYQPIKQPYPSSFFKSFKLLNVLDLECILIDCSFPEEVTSLFHLRYVAIWCLATELPLSISNLWNLEIVIVHSSAADIPLPSTIWQLQRLRHLGISSLSLTGIECHVFGRLEFLDMFSTPVLNSGRETEELLRRLPGLRKLSCKFIERPFDYKPYKFPELSRLNGLESLKVYSYGLVFFGEKRDQFPAFDFPNSLRRLTLGRFALPWTAISVIARLPNLEVLKLRDRAFSGSRWDVEDGGFLTLKFLELWQSNIKQWTVQDDPFPSLEKLVVKHCYSLEEIPLSLGYIPTLKKLEVQWCFKATSSARQILEEQLDMGNDGLEVIVLG